MDPNGYYSITINFVNFSIILLPKLEEIRIADLPLDP